MSIFPSGINKIDIAKADSFNPNNLISNGTFTNKNTMSEADIQAFLERKGSLLKDFTQDGKRASKIIYEAAQGITSSNIWANFGHPEWTEDVSINPQAILVTIQKEEGLIEGYYADPAHYNQVRLDWAMGYGYTESTIYNQYKGFYNQINLASWQLYWNYKRSQGMGYTGYQVGDTMNLTNPCNNLPDSYSCAVSGVSKSQDVHIDNRATASLYRYTPHAYNGNYNFWTYFNRWFIQQPYDYAWVTQNSHPSLRYGEMYVFQLTLRNTGTETWYGEGSSNPFRLGTEKPADRNCGFILGEGWISQNRIRMQESSVAPGSEAHFVFAMTAPGNLAPATYREHFKPVIENQQWLKDIGIYWDVAIMDPYKASWVSQNGHPDLNHGGTYQFELRLKNEGYETWNQDTFRLGTDRNPDRVPIFTRGDNWVSDNRIRMQESSVAPGQIATFRFSYSVPGNINIGNFKEYFRPVVDGVKWLNDMGIYWNIKVNNGYLFEYTSQNTYPTLLVGETYNFNLTIKNTSNITWYGEGNSNPVRLGTDRSRDRISGFNRGNGWVSDNRIRMQESSVAPGEYAHFNFEYTTPSSVNPGVYREYFRPVVENLTWMNDIGIYWDVNIVPSYQYDYSSQNAYPSLAPGEEYTFNLTVKNTSNVPWYGEGYPNPVRLGTNQEKDRIPIFERETGWVSSNRVKMQESKVDPGQNATFSFNYKVPYNVNPGTYREYFRLVREGLSWMNDTGIYWDIEVKPGYNYDFVNQNAYPELAPGESYSFNLAIKNTSNVTWYGEGNAYPVRLGTNQEKDRIPIFERISGWVSDNRIEMQESSVAPGEIAHFNFTYTVPLDLSPGVYREYFCPVIESVFWMKDIGIYWNIIVK